MNIRALLDVLIEQGEVHGVGGVPDSHAALHALCSVRTEACPLTTLGTPRENFDWTDATRGAMSGATGGLVSQKQGKDEGT